MHVLLHIHAHVLTGCSCCICVCVYVQVPDPEYAAADAVPGLTYYAEEHGVEEVGVMSHPPRHSHRRQ